MITAIGNLCTTNRDGVKKVAVDVRADQNGADAALHVEVIDKTFDQPVKLNPNEIKTVEAQHSASGEGFVTVTVVGADKQTRKWLNVDAWEAF